MKSYKFHLVVRNVNCQIKNDPMYRAIPGLAKRCVWRAGQASVVGRGTDDKSFGEFNKASASSLRGEKAFRDARVYAEYCNELSRPSPVA